MSDIATGAGNRNLVGFAAEFINEGIYRGRTTGGQWERFPAFSRLYSALVSAAHGRVAGELSVPVTDALGWLEANPPAYLSIPPHTRTVTGGSGFFGQSGRLNDSKSALQRNEYMAHYGTTMHRAYGWGWDSDTVPEQVRGVLSELCSEVAYLGTVKSACTLRFGVLDLPPTHELTPELGDGFLLDVVPTPGRYRELRSAYGKIVAAPAGKWDDDSVINNVTAARNAREFQQGARTSWCTRQAPYVAVERQAPQFGAPWTAGVWIPLKDSIPEQDRVKEAAHVHRAVVANAQNLGQVPDVLYGYRGKGSRRPEAVRNNVAYQVYGSAMTDVQHQFGDAPGILVLVPEGLSTADASVIIEASMRYVSANVDFSSGMCQVDPTRWWNPVPHGKQRVWTTVPVAASDGMSSVRGKDDPRESRRGAHFAAAQGLAYLLGGKAPGDDAFSAVRSSRRVDPPQAPRYVHKHTGGVPALYRATYDLAGVLPASASLSVGQSRHFGGGLLVPRDMETS